MNERESERRTLYICTVGTSIFSNIKRRKVESQTLRTIEQTDNKIKETKIEDIAQADTCEKIESIINKWHSETLSELCSSRNNTDTIHFGSSKPKTLSELCNLNEFNKYFEKLDDITDYSAELSTLKNYDPEIFSSKAEHCKVILIPTSTASSLCCAYLIKEYLSTKGINCDISCIGHLSFPNSTHFTEKGLPEFLSRVFELAKKGIDDGFEVILNPTGGYKSLFPLVTIVGILLKCKVIYKYEESNTVVEIPPIPLSIDLYKWYREFSKIEVYRDKPYMNKILNISEEFRPLVKDREGKLVTNMLYDFFKTHISQLDRRFNPLYIKATQTSLLDYLGQYRKKIVYLSEIVHLIWKGDRIPEMVDHGMRHHTNLIMIAERLLLPILHDDTNFFSPEELFILLCTIYFHDSGHVIGSIEKKREKILLFPDEIRDFHHILGFERLWNYNSPSYFSSTIYDYLLNTWEISDAPTIWDEYLKAPAYIGLYHRRAMPLLKGQPNYDKHTYLFGTPPYEPLEKLNGFSICRQKIPTDRILLLCALFRIIDSLDVQVARTGDDLEIKFHEEQLMNEIAEEEAKVQNYREFLDKFYRRVLEEIDTLFPNDNPKSSWEIREKLKEINRDHQAVALIAEEYVRSKLKIYFKNKQKKHFAKHKAIEQVLIEYLGKVNGIYQFRIDLKIRDEASDKEAQKTAAETLKELMDEYCSESNSSVKEILNRNNIEITYGGSE